MCRTLEVDKVPARRGVVRLHALNRKGEEGLALEVDGAVLGQDGALGHTPGPEGVPDGAPRVCWVGAKVAETLLADDEARCGLCDLEVDNGLLIIHRLDAVALAVLGELDGAVLGVKSGLVGAELVLSEGIRRPEVGL